MKIYIKIIFLGLIINFTSCTEVVDIDVPNEGERLVVEASINWKKGVDGKNQTIKLGKSTSYFGEQKNIEVVGAKVSVIKDNDGTEIIFNDQNDGNYTTTNFIAELNQSYTLKIEYNGKTYQAKETMMPISGINKVEQEVLNILEEDIIRVEVFFDDEKDIDNYYFTEFLVEGKLLPDLEVRDDRLTDGNENRIGFGGEDLEVGNKIGITLYGVSEQYYNYMRLLIEQAGGDGGGPFTSAPARLYGNCKNINDENEEVLGYFRLSEYDKTEYIIQENK